MTPTDPLYAQQWHFVGYPGGIDDPLGNIERIWDEFTGAGIHVGIYDTGVQSTHPDLAANYDASLHIELGGNEQSGDPDLSPGAQDPQTVGHGTHVAGVLAAVANNGLGGVGVAWGSSITGVNINEYFADNPNLTTLLEAIGQKVNFDVTNNSWNYTPAFDSASGLDPATWVGMIHGKYAEVAQLGRDTLGTVIVQGVGNDNLDAQGSGLNASRFTITVAGAGPDGFAADYSNYGACVLVTAPTAPTSPVPPGQGLGTTDLVGDDGGPGDYAMMGGTSGATPIVSGVVALMLEANPNLGWRDVQNILAASAKHIGSDSGDLGTDVAHANENGEWFFNGAGNWNGGGMHFSNDYGYGLVNAYNAVRMAEAWSMFGAAQTSANEFLSGPWTIDYGATPQVIGDQQTIEVPFGITHTNPDFNIRIEHVEVVIDLTHANFSELQIFLESPDGTEVQLSDGSTGDTAFATGMEWTFGIDALRGEDTFGDWTVRFVDANAGGGTGEINSIKLNFYGKLPFVDDVYHYTDEFLDMAAVAGEAGRTTLADTNGGTDWINAAAVTGNVALNLNAGMTTTVNSTNWFAIAGGTQIENAVSGDGNDTITGNGAANLLYGMRGNDILSGGLGDDLLDGGANNDTANYQAGGGVTVDLSLAGAQNTGSAGLDTLVSIENLIGSATGADTFTGNAFANVLSGLGGNDTLRGGDGNDVLTGGAGRDLLFGDLGFDDFDFNSKSETKKGGQRDQILQFTRGQDDIDLRTIDAKSGGGNQAFKFIGKQDFHDKKGELRYIDKGSKVIVQGDINGDGKADFEIFVKIGALAKGDFLL